MSHKHVYAIPAYGDSPYLESCIKSLKEQKVASPVIMCTSTPSPFLGAMAEKYDLPYYIREGKSNIRDDWNYAYSMADAEFVTIAHQDDMYGRNYVRTLAEYIRRFDDISVFTTDYVTVRQHNIQFCEQLTLVKKVLRLPLRIPYLNHLRPVKLASLLFGNSICCPACTYHKEMLGAPLFHSSCRFALDWDTLIDLAMRPGRFICVEEPLVFHRLHKDAATNACMKDSRRYEEERAMFRRLWPKPAAEFLMGFYKKAYTSYEEDGTEKKNGK